MQGMKRLLVGDVSRFAIETAIKESYDSESLMALGSFVVHVAGKSYGMPDADATLLAVPFDSIRRRISKRGRHRAPFSKFSDATALAEALVTAVYTETRPTEMALGLSISEIVKILDDNFIDWGPGGDEAFDDGTHIYQFDVDDSVRIVACKYRDDDDLCLSELWLPSDEFYSILNNWQKQFDLEWCALRGRQPPLTERLRK
jgi:Immunity protein 42